jgi:hypothetical protein
MRVSVTISETTLVKTIVRQRVKTNHKLYDHQLVQSPNNLRSIRQYANYRPRIDWMCKAT